MIKILLKFATKSISVFIPQQIAFEDANCAKRFYKINSVLLFNW